MKILSLAFTKDGDTIRLVELPLSDNSPIYNIEVLELEEKVFVIRAYDKKDAEERFAHLVAATKV